MRPSTARHLIVAAAAVIWGLAPVQPALCAGLSRTTRSTDASDPAPAATAPSQPGEAAGAPAAPARVRIAATSTQHIITTDGLYDAQLGPVVVSPGAGPGALAAPVASPTAVAPAQPVQEPSARLVLRPIGGLAVEQAPVVSSPALVGVGTVGTLDQPPSLDTDRPGSVPAPVSPTAPVTSESAPVTPRLAQAQVSAPRATIGPQQPGAAVAQPTLPVPLTAPPGQPRTQSAGYAASPGFAANPLASETVSVDPSLAAQMAVDNSIDLDITAASIAEARAQVRQAFGLDDFQLDISATYGRRGPTATMTLPVGEDGEDVELTLSGAEIDAQSLQLVKPLYTGGRIERSQQVALKSLETRKLSRGVVERALDIQARKTAYEVLRMEKLAEVARDRANAVAAHTELSKKLFEAGVVPKFEVVQAETKLAEAQGGVIGAHTAVEQTKAVLRRVLTIPQEKALTVQGGVAPAIPAGSQSDLIQMAWEKRPEIHTTEAGVTLAEAALRLAFASRNVSVSLTGGLTRTIAGFGSEPTNWQVAISATKPILDGKQEETEVQKAKAQLDTARLQLEKQRQDIALEVAQAHVALTDAQERLRVAEQGVVEAREALRISQVRYENGLALGVEVLDAQTALSAATAEVVNSTYNLYASIATLRSAAGLWIGNE